MLLLVKMSVIMETADVLKFKGNDIIVEQDKRNVATVLNDAKEGDRVVKVIFINQDSRDPCCFCFGHVGEILMGLVETISLHNL